MKTTIKFILIMLLVIALNFTLIANTVQAVEQGEITIYTKGNFNRFLKFGEMLIKTAHAVYNENGIEYPAYCLNKDLKGVGENLSSYNLTNEGKITDVGLWRVIINGYPYKSLESLGVISEEEAYTATKQAIYCYIYNRGTEQYSGVGEAGIRTRNAMDIILENARNSTENLGSTNIQLISDEKWRVENDYISKQYQINSDVNINKYFINLENIPNGYKLTDAKNNEKTEFNSDELFKISIPIKSLQKSGTFKINIKTQMETKPIFYAKAPSDDLQDYALTTITYEEIDTEKEDNYEKNTTKIIIEKQDSKTQEKLEGAQFKILDVNKNEIAVKETNKNGQIILDHILPGTYYIQEIKATEGYEVNDEIQQIEISLNEEKIIKVDNNKIVIIDEVPEKPEIPEIPEEPIKPEEPEKQKEPQQEIKSVEKLPVTGM